MGSNWANSNIVITILEQVDGLTVHKKLFGILGAPMIFSLKDKRYFTIEHE